MNLKNDADMDLINLHESSAPESSKRGDDICFSGAESVLADKILTA